MPLPIKGPLNSLLTTDAKHLATLWKIERTDGVVMYFTDHNATIVFGGVNYSPASGFNASARQKTSGLNPQNFEMVGVLDSDAIKQEDLRAGRYREAKITEILVDWRYPFAGSIYSNVYWVTETTFTDGQWNAQMQGMTKWLQAPVGRTFNRNCDTTLGSTRCTINLATQSAGGTVSAVNSSQKRLQFTASPGWGAPANWYNYGNLTWATGLNAGISMEVKTFTGSNVWTLVLPMPFDIQVGDTFLAISGCDKTHVTCKNKFSNLVNFQGFPFIPGSDKMLAYPDSK